MRRPPVPVIVFVDIDSAAVSPAGPGDGLAAVLERLAGDRIMLVLCSHRTRAEVESVRQTLGVFHPFICENGAAVFVPGRYFGSDPENTRVVGGYHAIEFGSPYAHVVETLRRVADRVNLAVTGFNDMSVEQVARECGISLLEARLAKLREYAEPFRLVSPNPVAERRLLKALGGAGLTCSPCGGFHHAGTVPGVASAVSVLTTLYRMAFGSIVTAVAGNEGWSREIAGSVDARFPGVVEDARAPVDWLGRIVQAVDDIRDAPVRAARQMR
jgi:predicted mannosyl-3-phosphoglycerate phosphatase (HAD superfamily)